MKSNLPTDADTAAAAEPSADESSTAESDSTDSDSGLVIESSPSASPRQRRHQVDENGFPYVGTLPRHERRRIQLDVRKNRKLGQLRLL